MSNAFVVGNGVKHSSDLIRSSRWEINGSGRLQSVNTEDIVQFTDDKLIEHPEIRFHLSIAIKRQIIQLDSSSFISTDFNLRNLPRSCQEILHK